MGVDTSGESEGLYAVGRLEWDDLKVEVITTESAFTQLESVWNDVFDQSEGSIFQTFEWSRTWWEYFGSDQSLYIILVKRGEETIAIFPLFKDSITYLGQTFYTGLRFIGSNISQPRKANMLGLISYTDYLDGIIKRGEASLVYECLIRFLSNEMNQMDEIVLDVISEQSLFWTHGWPKLQKQFGQLQTTDQETSQSVLCSDSWELYLQRLNKNRRHKAKVALRKIRGNEEEKIFCVRTAKNEHEFSQLWDEFVKLHQRKWNKQGSIGTFYEEANLRFHKDISLQFYKRGWAQMYALTPLGDDHNFLALDMNYTFKSTMYGAHTVTNGDSEYYKAGPGTALFYETLNRAIEQGLESYDFLRGTEAYKFAISDLSHKNRTVCIQNDQRLPMKRHIQDLLKRQELLKRSILRKIIGWSLQFKHTA